MKQPRTQNDDSRELTQMQEAERKDVSLDLVELRDFLNSSGKSEAEIREEIINLIMPIISSQPADEGNVLQQLKTIVKKANGLGIRSEWSVEEESPRGKVAEFAPGMLHKLWTRWLGPSNRILRIGGRKYSVRHDWREETSPRNYYLTVMDALEDGTLIKLKRCNQCGRFFIADRVSDRFCSSKCSRVSYGGEAAKNRVYAIRVGQKNLDKVLSLPARKIPQQVRGLLGGQTISELKRKRERGVAVSQLWKLIPNEAKSLLKEMPSIDIGLV
jgi:hypothetical protein